MNMKTYSPKEYIPVDGSVVYIEYEYTDDHANVKCTHFIGRFHLDSLLVGEGERGIHIGNANFWRYVKTAKLPFEDKTFPNFSPSPVVGSCYVCGMPQNTICGRLDCPGNRVTMEPWCGPHIMELKYQYFDSDPESEQKDYKKY